MKFYILTENDWKTEKGFTETEWMPVDPGNYGDAPVCPKCGAYLDGDEWLPPYRVALEMFTKEYGNVVLGIGRSIFLVDDYFRDRFPKTDLTGLEFIGEAEVSKLICRPGVRKKMLTEPPRYHLAKIRYGCAAIDQEKSGFVFEEGREPTCDYCRQGLVKRYDRIVIDESTWDGTDIFLARGIGGMRTTSQRFKDWWDTCEFNNCRVIPAEECHDDYS